LSKSNVPKDEPTGAAEPAPEEPDRINCNPWRGPAQPRQQQRLSDPYLSPGLSGVNTEIEKFRSDGGIRFSIARKTKQYHSQKRILLLR
jgi:hypothetical protein